MDCYSDYEYSKSTSPRMVAAHVNAIRKIYHNDSGVRIINIHVSAGDLPNDGKNRPDFICVMSTFGAKKWEKYARTEVSWESKIHEWVRPFTITYDPNGLHLLHFDIFQIISDLFSLKHQRRVCECEIDINALINSKDKCVIAPLVEVLDENYIVETKGSYYLTIKYTDVDLSLFGSYFIRTSFIHKLPKKIIKPHIFFTIETQNHIPIFVSNTHKLHKVIQFDMFEINKQFIVQKDNAPLTFYVHDNFNSNEVIGSFETTLQALTGASKAQEEVLNRDGKTIGYFEFYFFRSVDTPRVDDMRLRGILIRSIYAIDFSAGINCCDDYVMVLREIGNSLNFIAQMKPFQAFGFGLFKNQPKETLFSISNEKKNTFSSIQKIMNGFKKTLAKTITPHNSLLAPVIKHCKQDAIDKWKENNVFSIVTIITDGKILDLNKAIDEIVSCDQVPICFLLITNKKPKNILVKSFTNIHGIVTNSEGKKTKRRIIRLLYYANSIVNKPHNLRKAGDAVVKMIQEWGEVYCFPNKE